MTDNIENVRTGSVQDDELSKIANKIESFYWLPILKTPFGSLNEMCNDVDQDCQALALPFKSLTSNLHAAEKMLYLPYLLITPETVGSAIEIKGLSILEEYDSNNEKYSENLLNFTKLVLGKSGDILIEKKQQLTYLMFQACILIWSALENYCKDVFILMLNKRPQLYKKLLADSFLKDKFSISNASWEKLLEEHGYDLNGKLGYIIASNKDFSSPLLLQKLFHIILDDHPEPKESLDYFKSDMLWLLGQRRHLLVHRCGVVDKEYIDKTHDAQQKIGEKLYLRGRDIAESFAIVAQCSIVLYGTARHLWERPNSETNLNS